MEAEVVVYVVSFTVPPAGVLYPWEGLMRRLICLACVVVVVGCTKKEEAQTAADSAAAAPAAAPAPPPPTPINLADLAGTWDMKVMREGSDSVLLSYQMMAKAEPTGWTIKFPNRPKPVDVQVTASGDSIITHAGPYESALRKGVQVTTDGVMRLDNGKLVGTTVAHYKTTTPDSVVNLRQEGTKAAK